MAGWKLLEPNRARSISIDEVLLRWKRVQKFIDSLPNIRWLSHVGELYAKPPWASAMRQELSWVSAGFAAEKASRKSAMDAAMLAALDVAGIVALDTARSAAWDAAWETVQNISRSAACSAAWDASGCVAEIIGGVEDGYFSRLMEIYQAGHYPCHYEGGELVVY